MEEPPKIVQLPQEVINQIAAGEVIHQPINVVKELFENALDAEAYQIEINLENGGFSLIQIIDNGCGISKQDLPNVCLRHSTSKIHQFIDLTTKLSTFGFRGEALFSMSCVSHLSITTKTKNSDVALIAHYENGQICGNPEPIASVNGTVVEVRDIFYNKPEKLRAIPDSNSQNRQVLQMATQYSIAYPQVSIVVNIDGKERLHTLGNTNTESVLALIYGLTADDAVFKVEADLGSKTSAQLFLGTIASTRTMKGSAIFVNNRLVRCERVKRAMEIVYSEFLKKGDKPFFVIMLSIPPRHVDVNVHPTKRDVNFENSQIIIERLCNIAREALAERIGGKTFKQTSSNQSTIENSISSRASSKVNSKKKKSEIEMQIQGSVQSSIITAPTFAASQPIRKNNDDSDNEEFESQPSQSSQKARPKSLRSIFDELKYTGMGSTNNKNDNSSSFNENNQKYDRSEFNNSITTEPPNYFRNKSQKNDENIDTYQESQENDDSVNDQYFDNPQDSHADFSIHDFNQENENSDENEDESDSIDDEDENVENDISNEPPKKRRFGLNLQPLSQIPPSSPKVKATVVSQPIDSNFLSQKTAKNHSKANSIFEELKYERYSSSSKLTRGDPRERTIEQMFSLSAALKNQQTDNDPEDDIHSKYREIELESILELREREKRESSKELCQLFSKNIYVGTLELKYVFFSSDDALYMCDLFALTRLFFFQLFLRHFANYGAIRFDEPIDISRIIHEFVVNNEEADDNVYDYIISELNNHAEMLDDYFRIKIKGNQLFTMPDILPGYEPSFTALGLFFVRIITEVNWCCEYDCICAILDELSMLYAIQPDDSLDEELVVSTKKMIANVIMPEIKTEAFMPKINLVTDRSLKRLKNASEMYKIFERT